MQEKLKAFADNLDQILTTNSDVHRTFTVNTEQVVNNFLKQPLIDRERATNRSEIPSIVGTSKHAKQLCLTGYRIKYFNICRG